MQNSEPDSTRPSFEQNFQMPPDDAQQQPYTGAGFQGDPGGLQGENPLHGQAASQPSGEQPNEFSARQAQAFVNVPPSGYVVDPVTGRLFYTVPVQGDPASMGAPQFQAPPPNMGAQPSSVHPPPPPGPDYAQVIKSVEQFAQGDASVGDVIKTLYTNTAQDDQFWKGAIVGAAAAVLLTSGSVGKSLEKTFEGLFGTTGSTDNEAENQDLPKENK